MSGATTAGVTDTVPALRFPEFEGEWEEKRFDQFFQIRAGGDIDELRVQKSKDVQFRYPVYANSAKMDGLYGYSDIFKIEEKCVTVAGRGVNIGLAVARTEPFYPIVRLLVLIPKQKADVQFLQAAISRTRIFVESTGVPQLTAPQMSSYKIWHPRHPEQKKIAAFFGGVDAKIAALRERGAGLERYKRGLMQALFSQTLRFTKPDGSPFPDWEEKRLGDLCDALSGYPVAGDEIVETPTDTPLLRGINITEGTIRHTPEMDKYHGGDVEGLERFLVEEGDVVVAMDGSKVGKNVATISEKDAGSFLIQRVTRLRRDSRNDLRLVYQHVTSHRFRNYVDIVNTSSGIPHISLKQIKDFLIPTPHPDEQAKIAEALQAMDVKIAAVTGQLDRMQDFKKGLLQQMFV